MNLTTFETQKVNLIIGSRFRRRVVAHGLGTSEGFMGQKFVPSSDIASGRSGRPRPRTSDPKSNLAVLAYNYRLCRVSTFLSTYSESTQNLSSTGYMMDLSDSCTPELRFGFGLSANLLGQTHRTLLRFKPKLRN